MTPEGLALVMYRMNLRTVEERYQGRRAERMAEESTFFRYEPVDAAPPL